MFILRFILFLLIPIASSGSFAFENKQQVVDFILKDKNLNTKTDNVGVGKANINIALCKYWGKRNEKLNLPYTSSISIALPYVTDTRISHTKGADEIYLNRKKVKPTEDFAKRTSKFLDLFRKNGVFFKVETTNDVPTASGLASSASGFAALVLAINDLYKLNLSEEKLSILARLGSGSASRSIYNGFAMWYAGTEANGMDSYAKNMNISPINNLRVGLLITTSKSKAISSRQGMKSSVETSPYYDAWLKKSKADLLKMKQCLVRRDIDCIGSVAESNAFAMHATAITADPYNIYWNKNTVKLLDEVQKMRQSGIPVYVTMDAGPHIKLLFDVKYSEEIQKQFPQIAIHKVAW